MTPRDVLIHLQANPTGGLIADNLTVRDYFAGLAMQGFAADPSNHELFDDMADVANNAYELADAMLQERSK